MNYEGKWVLVSPVWIGAVCSMKPLFVRSQSGRRIYVNEIETVWNGDAGEYVNTENLIDAGYKSASSVVFAFSRKESAVEVAELHKRLHDDWFMVQKKAMQKSVLDMAKSIE